MSIIKNALIEEIKERTKTSQTYYDLIQLAKTETKKNFYKKKLFIHNNSLADLIISLDKLNATHYNSEDTNNIGNDNNVESTPTSKN